jgi:ectoine hydroxylase-related dioxygenase (phytanoyl-CoA dioxygenase family)
MIVKMRNTLFLCIIAVLLVVIAYTVYASTALSYADILQRDGVVHIPNNLPSSLRNRAISTVYQQLGDCKGRKMGDINNVSNKRVDVSLPMYPCIKDIIRHVWTEYKTVWTAHLGCSNPRLVECSALITFPGAGAQEWHRDTHYGATKGRLLSIGVALQDITETMAPLEAVKQTHTTRDDVDESLGELMVCSKDDLVAWDSAVYHRGTSNTSDIARVVFNMTLASDGPLPTGATYSLLPRYKHLRIESI